MDNLKTEIFSQVDAELAYAEAKWGVEFDDENTLNDWIAYAVNYLGQAARMDANKDKQEAALIKAVGILVNALSRVKTQTLAPRHYDKLRGTMKNG